MRDLTRLQSCQNCVTGDNFSRELFDRMRRNGHPDFHPGRYRAYASQSTNDSPPMNRPNVRDAAPGLCHLNIFPSSGLQTSPGQHQSLVRQPPRRKCPEWIHGHHPLTSLKISGILIPMGLNCGHCPRVCPISNTATSMPSSLASNTAIYTIPLCMVTRNSLV